MILKKGPILNYKGLYGDDEGNYSSEYIFLELIATRSQNFNWVIKPHIHTHLFQIFFICKGSVEFINNGLTPKIKAPCIFVIPPTLMHGFAYSKDIEGYILSISESVVNDIFKTSLLIDNFHQIYVVKKFYDNDSFEEILQYITKIERELLSNFFERMTMIKAILSSLFVTIFRLCDIETQKNVNANNYQYFKRFSQLIKHSNQKKTVSSCANELNISTVHLNRICKSAVGKPASEIIDEYIIIEAQKYLLHTTNSISEIAYKLHFEYANYFSRKFKKHTGITPEAYRKLDRS
ncbi:helix-turn-helix domain-containing protein [Parasediminibacterium paludis]|uniref:Helix-turn-helix domain-containing protein n=1 Tax=Parasediminibacterium paludis TaxID=908966 RepID=A0ABV8PTA1_9BACT